MMFGIRLLALVVLLVSFASSASAATVGGPATGLWYNIQNPGRGYGIDIQGDLMIVKTYIYETSGDPIWYLSSGTYNHATSVFTSTYDSYSNGQCFGCPWHQPTVQVGAAGPITITFHTNQTATLSYPGGTTEITKYNYGFASKTDALYGEWVFTYENAGTVGGDWLVFDHAFTDTTNTVFAAGYVVGAPTFTVLGIYNTTTREVEMAVSRGTGQHLYRFGIFDDRRAIGIAATQEGTQPPSAAMTASGARLLFKSELAGGIIGSAGDAAAAQAQVPQEMQQPAIAQPIDNESIAPLASRALAEYLATQQR
jgi:hypothetical protein